MKTYNIQNIICKLGQNSKENWNLLDSYCNEPKFLFFHLSSFPSGYLIIECNEHPSLSIIKSAADICRNGTKYKKIKNIKVDYTTLDNVKKGCYVGEILYKSNRKVNQIII
jgi:predicted ribosome quality control (RQC) complex YloA/Tae2 family protein